LLGTENIKEKMLRLSFNHNPGFICNRITQLTILTFPTIAITENKAIKKFLGRILFNQIDKPKVCRKLAVS